MIDNSPSKSGSDTESSTTGDGAIRSRSSAAEMIGKSISLVAPEDHIALAVSRDRVFSYVTPNWKNIVGHGVSDVVGRPFQDFLHPDDAPQCLAALDRVIETAQKVSGIEYRVRRKDGAFRWHSLSALPIVDADGKVDFLVGVARDITERKEVNELRARHEFISQYARDPMLLVRLDGTIVEGNQAAIDFYKYSHEELLNLNIEDLRPGDDPQTVRRQMQEAQHRGILFETVHVLKDGTEVPVEVNSQRVRIEDEELLLSVVRDISVRKWTEEQLRESEEKWRSIINASPDGILIVSHEGVIQRASQKACALVMYDSEEDMIGCSIFDFLIPEEQERAKQVFTTALQGRNLGTVQYTSVRKDGTRIPLEANREVLRDSDEKPMGMLLVLRDITERMALEDQLRQAQKLESIGRLAGGVAHDFNNMLEVILGYVDMAMERVDRAASLYDDLLQIQTAAQRSADLTRKLLAFARKQVISPKTLDLNEVITNMMSLLRRLIGENIEMIWKPASDLWLVRVDPDQVDQILANLVINSRDAITGTGRLFISTENATLTGKSAVPDGPGTGDFVVLEVTDTGCGMDKQTLSHIFEPFFTTKKPGTGTGLGLPVVYGMVKQNHGFVTVTSEPGQGATFKLYLPRVQSTEQPGSTQKEILGGTETILITEDEEAILDLNKSILLHNGYTVLAASNPHDALKIAREHDGPIHLLLTDVIMPEINGRELRDRLLALRPDMKTLFMSGFTADVIASQGILDENVDLLEKPFSGQVLLQRIRKALK